MALTGDETRKIMITAAANISAVPNNVTDAEDSLIFKTESNAEGDRGVYALTPAGAVERLAWASEAGGGGGGPVLLARHAKTTVSDTTTETDILSITIPANTLGTDKQLSVDFGGLITNTSGATATCRLRIYLGATKMWDDVSPSLASNANGRGLYMRLLLANEGATNAQDLSGLVVIGGVGATAAGRGDIGSDEIASHAAIDGAATQDSTGELILRVACVMSVANAAYTVVRYRCNSLVV